MAPLSIQMLHVHYRGSTLAILDSDDKSPVYTVNCTTSPSQMCLVPTPTSSGRLSSASTRPVATAIFPKLKTEVALNIHGRAVTLRREATFTRTYTFISPTTSTPLFWKADGALTGDFKLVDGRDNVKARFRNKVFCASELGSFEIVGEMQDEERDAVVISGLAMLTMVQSGQLALVVLVGGKD
jgi:hypothetical protein